MDDLDALDELDAIDQLKEINEITPEEEMFALQQLDAIQNENQIDTLEIIHKLDTITQENIIREEDVKNRIHNLQYMNLLKENAMLQQLELEEQAERTNPPYYQINNPITGPDHGDGDGHAVGDSLGPIPIPVVKNVPCFEKQTESIYTKKVIGPFDVEKFIIIPDGNYTSQGLINTLNNLLSPLDEDGNLLEPNSIFSYIEFNLDIDEHNSGTGKVIIRPAETHTDLINKITLDFMRNKQGSSDTTSILTKIGWNLGFIKPKYEGSNTYISDTIFEMNSIRYVYLAVDDFNNNSNNQFISIFNKSILNPNILARIAIKGSFFGSVQENNFTIITEPRQYFGPVDIQRLRIQLYDEYGRILNMNNANFSFCLDFKLMYDL